MGNNEELFLFPDAATYLPEVDEWLSGEPPKLFSLARHWLSEFRHCGTDVNENMHDGCPTACVEGAAFGCDNVFKNHVNVCFSIGAQLNDPHSLLVGIGKRMRHVKIRPGEDIDTEALSEPIRSAYRDVKTKL